MRRVVGQREGGYNSAGAPVFLPLAHVLSSWNVVQYSCSISVQAALLQVFVLLGCMASEFGTTV